MTDNTELARVLREIAASLKLNSWSDRTVNALLKAAAALEAKPAQEPVTIMHLVSMLEGSSANTDTDWRWRAATALRQAPGWQTMTIPLYASPPEPSAAAPWDPQSPLYHGL